MKPTLQGYKHIPNFVTNLQCRATNMARVCHKVGHIFPL